MRIHCGQSRRSGIALIFVLIVISILTLSAYVFTNLMLAEKQAVVLAGRQTQARALVDSGVDSLRVFLELDKVTRQEQGGVFDNPQWFQGILVTPSEISGARGRFAIVAPMLDDQGYFGGMRFGLENESARLNLNALSLEVEEEEEPEDDSGESLSSTGGETGGGGGSSGSAASVVSSADQGESSSGSESGGEGEKEEPIDTSGRGMLMRLPGMTEDIADAILDWLDEDDDIREFGAEIEYYGSLNYAPKNGPLETIEELLMVRGVTPDLLFGRDVNRNGMIDMHEQDVPLLYDDPTMERGWSAFLTIHSQEKNVDIDGNPRIDLNGEDLQTLHDELSLVLSEDWATFIVAYRQSGPYSGTSNETVSAGGQELDFTRPGSVPLTQVLDLVGVRVEAYLAGGERAIFEAPFPDEPFAMGAYMPMLMDKCTVNPNPIIPGRVNINQAPWSVLMAIPGMTEEIAEGIINERDIVDAETDQNLRHETWLLTRAIVTLDEMKDLMPYVTAGGDVFRAQVVGYFDEGAISARSEIVIDATEAMPRIVFWRDISHLGRGFAAETLGIIPY